jgi:hypothetical protein
MTRNAVRVRGRARALMAAGAVGAVLWLAACSTGGAAAPHLPTGPSAAPTAPGTGATRPPPSQALLLVPAVWRVRAAAGESSRTWIRFDEQIDLIRPKGDVELSWTTQGDALLAHVEGWSMTLGTTPPAVPWLTRTTRFTRVGGEWVLTDAAGRQTARLVRDGAPPPSKQALHTVPKVDERVRERLADAVAGRSVRAVDPAAVVGTWGLPGVAVADGSVTLRGDGIWTARSSCRALGDANGGGGAYRLLPSGLLLVTESAIGGTGCTEPEHDPPAGTTAILEFFTAGSVEVHGARMTVFGRTGRPLGVLERKR